MLENINQYGAVIGTGGVGVLAVLATWLRFSRTRTEVSGDDVRRASDISAIKTMESQQKRLEEEYERRRVLESEVRRLSDLMADTRGIVRQQDQFITSQRERIRNLVLQVEKLDIEKGNAIRAFAITTVGPLD